MIYTLKKSLAREKKTKIEVIYCRVILRLARHVADTVCVVVSYYQWVIIFSTLWVYAETYRGEAIAFHGSGVMKKTIPGVAVLSPLYDYRLWVLIRVLFNFDNKLYNQQ